MGLSFWGGEFSFVGGIFRRSQRKRMPSWRDPKKKETRPGVACFLSSEERPRHEHSFVAGQRHATVCKRQLEEGGGIARDMTKPPSLPMLPKQTTLLGQSE